MFYYHGENGQDNFSLVKVFLLKTKFRTTACIVLVQCESENCPLSLYVYSSKLLSELAVTKLERAQYTAVYTNARKRMHATSAIKTPARIECVTLY